MANKTRIIFRGSFAPLMSAIRIGPEITRITVDIPQSEQLNAVGLQALLQKPLLFTVVVDDSPASTRIERPDEKHNGNGKPDKGPHGKVYTGLFKQGFQNSMELLQALGVEQPSQVKDALHTVFQTDTLTTVSAERFMEWAEQSNLHSLVTMCRQIQAKVKE